jgi:uncharacterized protein (TIGR02466 family)
MSVNMTLGKYFPTPMGFGNNLSLAQKYLPIVENLLSNPTTCNDTFFPNGRTTHSINGFKLVDQPEFAEMKQWIIDIGDEFMHQCGYRRGSLQNEVFIIANALDYGGFHKSHVHFDCVLSGVIYLTAPEGASALEFEDPITERALRKFPIEDYNNELTWEYTYNIPQVGNYVIFPHWLRHMVLQNESTEPRIAVAFNIG